MDLHLYLVALLPLVAVQEEVRMELEIVTDMMVDQEAEFLNLLEHNMLHMELLDKEIMVE